MINAAQAQATYPPLSLENSLFFLFCGDGESCNDNNKVKIQVNKIIFENTKSSRGSLPGAMTGKTIVL